MSKKARLVATLSLLVCGSCLSPTGDDGTFFFAVVDPATLAPEDQVSIEEPLSIVPTGDGFVLTVGLQTTCLPQNADGEFGVAGRAISIVVETSYYAGCPQDVIGWIVSQVIVQDLVPGVWRLTLVRRSRESGEEVLVARTAVTVGPNR